MWVGEVLDSEHAVSQTFLLKGPSIKLGRSAENDLVFAADKSISRVHAELVVDSAASTLHIIDLASRYGSSVSTAKLPPNAPYKVEHGAIARFGVGTVRIRFLRRQYSFCTTRLEKPDKDKLKRCAKLLGARMVSQAEHATHVVASKAAATVKMLTALVLPLKLVTVDWAGFAESTKAAVLIPAEEGFAPPSTEEVAVKEPRQSRAALLSSYTIFLLSAYDEQYSRVCAACGAEVVQCWRLAEEKGSSVVQAVASQGSAAASAGRQLCLFFDESRGLDCDKILMDDCRVALRASSGGAEIISRSSNSGSKAEALRWLTAGQLAASIINFAAPNLLTDPPKAARVAVGGSFCSQSQFTGGHSHSQLLPSAVPYDSSRAALLLPPRVPDAPLVPLGRDATATSSRSQSRLGSGVESADFATAQSLHTVREGAAQPQPSGASAVPPSKQVSVKEEVKVVPTPAEQQKLSIAAREEQPAVVESVVMSPAADATASRKRKPVLPSHDWDAEEPQSVQPGSTTAAAKRQRVGQAAAGIADDGQVDQVWPSPAVPGPASSSSSLRQPVTSSAPTLAPIAPPAPAQEKPSTLTGRANHRDEDEEDQLFSEADVMVAAKRSSAVPVAPVTIVRAAPSSAPQVPAARKETNAAPAPSRSSVFLAAFQENDEAADDGEGGSWVTALRGSERTAVVQSYKEKAQASAAAQDSGDDGDGDEPRDGASRAGGHRGGALQPSAGVIEKVTLLCTPTAFYGAVTLQGASSSSVVPASSARNVKVFRKNSVCRVDAREKMSFSAMQMVLPKESEREIQLRLEADARKEMENFADHMMSDKFTTGAVRKKIS